MATAPIQRRNDAGALIPDRLYFKIGDVATICGVATSVLRFWETQFTQLKPNKGGSGQRLYRKRDVELALEIKRLVHEQGYTLAGARQALAAQPARKIRGQHPTEVWQGSLLQARPVERGAVLADVKQELREMLMMLSRPAGMEPARKDKKIEKVIAMEVREEPVQMGLFAV